MLGLVVRFADAARASGLRASTSEVLDCARHLALIDPLDPSQVRTVFRANFAKSQREQARFDRVYDLFFAPVSAGAESEATALGRLLDRVVAALRERAGSGDAVQSSLELLAGDPTRYLAHLGDLDRADPAQPLTGRFANLGQVAGRMEVLLALGEIRGLVGRLLEDAGDLPARVRQDAERHFQARLAAAQELLTERPRLENAGLVRPRACEQRARRLGETPFASLSPREVQEMREVVDHLVRKLKDVVGRRHAARSRGPLDLKRTLRRSARYQGVPLELRWRGTPPRKGKIVTLCDVSSSVWFAARFMLNLLYALQDCFTRVRSFVFVAELAEVTSVFEHQEINRAVDQVLQEADVDYGARTDYGAVLRQFATEQLDILNKKTTVIIVGDGRSNYLSPEGDLLERMRERSRRVIWLNPESPRFWYTGDSEMRTYERHCHEVRPCRNLDQLMVFIQELVL